jgi:site-specific recombinase XerD
MREAVHISNWEDAQRKIRQWESGVPDPVHVAVEAAITQFLADIQARNMAKSTLKKYRHTLEKVLKPFCKHQNITNLDQLEPSDMISLRSTWTGAGMTLLKKFDRLRTFFLFCERNQWCENPCRGLKPPKVVRKPTLPFTDWEMQKILGACDGWSTSGKYGQSSPKRVKAFVLVMRYTGLRIGDTVQLSKDKVQNGKVFLTTQKTGVQVWVPIPDFVLAALNEIEGLSKYYFWNGGGTPLTAESIWQRTLKKLFTLANITGGHSHRFRTSFACSLLEKNVSLENVAILLGNSPAIVEKHYSPFVASRREILEQQVMATWA